MIGYAIRITPRAVAMSFPMSFLVSCVMAFLLCGCSSNKDGGGSNAELPSADDLVSGLTKYQVCGVGHSYTVSEYVEELLAPEYDQVVTEETVQVLECYASAADCTQLLACSVCQSRDSWCDGDVTMDCVQGAPMGQDCGAMGMTCLMGGDVAVCSEGVGQRSQVPGRLPARPGRRPRRRRGPRSGRGAGCGRGRLALLSGRRGRGGSPGHGYQPATRSSKGQNRHGKQTASDKPG